MPASHHAPAVLSTSQAAVELGVSERTLRRYIQAGLIGFRRLPGGHYRIPREAIEDFWRAHAPRARPSGRRAPLVDHPRPRAGQGPMADGVSKRRPRLSAQATPRAYEIPLRSRPS